MLQPVSPRVTEGLAALTTDERRDAHFADLIDAVKHAGERYAPELVRLARSPSPPAPPRGGHTATGALRTAQPLTAVRG
jgi:hypothetical protein